MDRTDLRFSTPDGTGEAWLFAPDAGGPHPLVVLGMDAFGLRPALETMGRRLAGAGYVVALPNYFWRSGAFAPFDAKTAFSVPDERTRLRALMDAVTPAQVGADTDALLAHLATDPRVKPGPIGLVGYCMGGRQSFLLAARLGARAGAMASIHGGGLVRPDATSPHLGAPQIRARCYFAVADQDPSCTPADVATLQAALQAAGVRHQIEVYPGKLHGFAPPDTQAYDAAASEQHWARVIALFGEELR